MRRGMVFKEYNFPIILTLTRLLLSPIVIPLLLFYLLPYNHIVINAILAHIFILFGLTDFFDGYLARRYQQETVLGRVLDPIADKFLIFSTLIALLAVEKIYFFWVILFVGREFFVMALRQLSLEHNFSLLVSTGGKFKTAIQFIMLSFIILNPYHHFGMMKCIKWNIIEQGLLMLALFLSLYTAYRYYRAFMNRLSITGIYSIEMAKGFSEHE